MSQKKFLDKIGLQNFLNRIKALIPTKTSELQNDSGFITSEGTYDSALSLESEKAVQNKVVTAAINGKQETLSTAQTNAVDSGITSAKVQGYDSHISDTDIHVTQVDKTSWDSKASGTHTHLASEVSGLSTVATSGSYSDLTNKPTIDSALSSTSTNAVQNKVINTELGKKANTTDLATVATSGSYADLSNKPSIPSKTSDLTNDSGFLTSHNPIDSSLSSTSTNAVQNKVINTELGKKANTTDLATVATSGSYNDLSNKPTIPTVNNATLTIQKNGTTVKTFTANSSTNVTADITVPTKVSELTNDSGFLTSHSPVDSALSTTSENAVQNKVVKAELDLKANSADLSTVATTGSYTDLNNIPSNFTPASHTHGSITNDGKLGTASRAMITDGNKKIAVSSVTSTELGYLSGVTSAVQDQLDGKAASTHSHAASEVSGLATVATSGSYNDLTNKPTIPTVNNATLTIQKNGTTVKTFTANASSNVTANITVPTKVSELTNDSGFLTSHNPVDSALSDTSTNAVQNKIVKGALDGKSDTGHTHTVSEVSGLSTVATSGSYNDLTNKPTIPTVNNATLTIQKNGTTVKTFTANASSNVTANITVPTKVSELTNDSGFLTSASSLDSSKLTGTIDIARLPKGALERLVTVADQTARFALTTSDVQLGDTVKQLDTGVMYIVTDESKLSSADGYTEYTAGAATSVPWSGVTGKPSNYTPSSHSHGNIANGGTLGTASRALITDGNKKITTSSVTSTELGYVSGVTSAIQTQLDGKAASSHTHTASEVSGLSTVATSGSYNDLSNKPTIDSALSSTSTNAVQNKVINTALAGKAASSHTHTKSQITDFPTKTSQFTNDSHQTITVGTDTTSTASPAHSGTFTCIDSVTRDSNGHVTAVNTKTVTLPADNNTDTLVTQNVSTANENHPVLLTVTKDATANQGAKTSIFASGVKVNPSTNTVTATTFSGALSGNASTATQFSANKSVTLTGDVTGTASSKAGWSVATTLSDSGVTAGTYGPSADVTGNNNATISVPEITVDSKGRVTSVANRTLTCKNNTYNVYNKTLTIQKNGTNVATFTSNSNTDVTANITVPTKVSELTNDSGFLTSHQSLSNYVTLNSEQTITGNKNFEGQLKINGYNWVIRYKTQGTSNYANYDTFKQIEYNKFNNIITLRRSADVLNSGDNFNVVDTSFAFYKIHVRSKYVDLVDNTRFINDGTTNAVYPITTNATSLGTSSNVWSNVYATTFTGALTGNVTGNCSGSSGSCTGNAATATQFSANKSVTLTGDVTGTASSKAGWSVATTLANSGVTAGTYGPSADVTGNNNATISVPQITVDAKGRVTSVTNRTLTCKNNTYTVNNATLTIQKNGTNVATFTSNASSNVTANITVPTKTSELTNNSGFLTSHQDLSLYPYKVASFSNYGNGRWQAINLGDTTTHPNGFNEIVATGKYQVRWTNATTVGVPFTTSAEVDGILEVDGISSASGVSSYQRVVQRIYRCSAAHIVYFRYGAYHDGTWNWSDWTSYGDIVTHNASEFLTSHQSLAGYLPLTGGTMTGDLNGTNVYVSGGFAKKHASITKGTNPSATSYWTLTFADKNGVNYSNNCLGMLETSITTGGVVSTYIRAMKNTAANSTCAQITAVYDTANSTAYATCPTPAANSNDTKIATTAWVVAKGYLTSHQSLANYVTLNGDQTISGAKTFTGDVIGINKDNSTENANDLYSTTAGSKLTYYTTTNGGTKLTNVPAAVNTTLESRTIRRLSASDWIVEQICHNSNGLYYRKGTSGTWSAWKTFAFTDSSITGTAANVTGTVAIANGGTGATSRLNAVKALTNENVGTGTNYFLTITSNWGKAGYCSVADAKTVLGLGSAAYTASTAYAAASHTHTKSQITDFPTKVSAFTNDAGYLTSHQSLANYVTLNGAQTITATKTHTANLYFKNTAITNYKAAPTADISNIALVFNSNENKFFGAISHNYFTNGHSVIGLELSNWTTKGQQGWWRLDYGVDKAFSQVYFRPNGDNFCNLGDSSNRWKACYATNFYGALTGNVTGNCSGSSGSCTGNAATATKATKATGNANGKELTNSIIKGLSISGKTITYTQIDGSTGTLTTQDTVYTHPTSAGNKHVPSGGSSGQFLGWDSAGTAKWVNNPNTDTKVRQDVGTSSTERPILSRYNTEDASQTANYVVYDTGVTNNPKTHTLTASGGFKGNLTGNVTGNCSGTSANVTGTVAIANGGTGATSRLNAVKALTNENVGTDSQYFIAITSGWGKAGYCSVADARTVLGIPTFDFQKFVWDSTIRLSSMAQSSEWEQISGGYKYTANVSLKAGQLTWIYVYLTTSNDLIKIVITNGYILSGKNCIDGGKNSIKADTTTYGNVLTQTVCGASRLNCLFYPYNSTVTLTMTYTLQNHAGGEDPSLSGKVLIKQ